VRKYLIVVDMQNDFISGPLGTPEAAAVLPKVVEKIWEFDGTVLFTYDTHGETYADTLEGKNLPVCHCVEGTEGWRLPKELEDLRFTIGGRAFTKPAFGSRELGEYLERENGKQPISYIELVGLCTDICVISNALLLKAFLPETEVAVDARCCAGVTPESHERALAAMEACQVTILRDAAPPLGEHTSEL
jgi:nicotinamidase-related amidase